MNDSLEIPARSPLCHSHAEEMASVWTHAAGVLLSIAALIGMVATAWGDTWETVSAIVFGCSLVLLYLFSTLYHFFTTVRAKGIFQSLDHAGIYILIAGSYTPVMLVSLRGWIGWTLLGIVWFMALAGVIVKTVLTGKRDHWISTALYVLMGWLIVVVLGPLIRAIPTAGFVWLVAGGLSYTFGIVFFQWRKLRYHHAIWHLFVLGGSACHVVAVWLYVFR